MKFSIIVPVYNAEKYLSECIGSVMKQTYGDYELILVDDGSAKPCAALCDEMSASDNKIRVLHRKNGGQLTARLDGAAAAKGDYCLFLDADDLLTPDCLQTLKDAAGRNNDPDMLIWSFCYVDPDGAKRPAAPLFAEERTFTEETKKDLYNLFLTGTGLNNVWTKAVKREVFNGDYPDYTPYERLRVAEDRLLCMGLVTNARRIVYLPETLYLYRLFPGSVTRQYTPEAVERFNISVLYPCEIGYLRQWGLMNDDTLQRLRASFISQAIYCLDRFYRGTDAPGRQKLAAYPWNTFLPEDCIKDFQTNPYLNDVQKKVFSMMLANDAKGLKKHFLQKEIVKKLRAARRKLTG